MNTGQGDGETGRRGERASPFLPVRNDCRFFTGYKPCRYNRPCKGCPHFEEGPREGPEILLPSEPGFPDEKVQSVLVIHYGAMGAVLQSTALLPAIQRKYPGSTITWITEKACLPLLENNSFLQKALPAPSGGGEAGISAPAWDVIISLDKGREPAGLASRLPAPRKYGFATSPWGNITGFGKEADYALALGLDNDLKFKKNKMTNQEIWAGLAKLPYRREPCVLSLSPEEESSSTTYRSGEARGAARVIGINTGCADNFPYKKLTIERHVELLHALLTAFPKDPVFLLGGKAETERNKSIAAPFRNDPARSARVVETPTTEGLRRGFVYENACDLVISGDSLGMHIAIALGKKVVAWFSLTCDPEIDLYDRGVKIRADVTCGPCWLSSCSMEPKCYDQVPVDKIVEAVKTLS